MKKPEELKPLVPGFPFSEAFAFYLYRKRIGLRDFEVSTLDQLAEFDRERGKMQRVLQKKQLTAELVDIFLPSDLQGAVNYRFAAHRQKNDLASQTYAKKCLLKLMARLAELEQAIAKLPRRSRGKLNKEVAKQEWHLFDTEMITALLDDVSKALESATPKCWADAALKVIHQPLALASFALQARGRSDLNDLWESLSPWTRNAVEERISRGRRPISLTRFLRELVALLAEMSLQDEARIKLVRRTDLMRQFGRPIANEWRKSGLRVGRANVWKDECLYESEGAIQQYCNAALRAVGDRTRLTPGNVRAIKREIGDVKCKTA
jgi:hypothetical protein